MNHSPRRVRLRSTAFRVLLIAGVLAVAVPALPAAAQDFAGLSRQLRSPDWRVRYGAVIDLDRPPVSSLPDSIRVQLIRLLESEALDPDRGPPPGQGEAYGEYVSDLSVLVVKLQDPRAIRALALLGIQVSRDAEEFLAAQGTAALPALNESWKRGEFSRNPVMDTWGLLIARAPGNGLTADDVSGILRRMLAGADSARIGFSGAAADTAGLVSAVPIMERFLQDDPSDELQRRWIAHLDTLRDSMSPVQLLARLRLWTEGICQEAADARYEACVSMRSPLLAAGKRFAFGLPDAALKSLAAVAEQVKAAREQNVFSVDEGLLISRNIRYIADRMRDAPSTPGPAAPLDTLQYDARHRLYTLTYLDDGGVTRQMVIVPPNHIEPAMRVQIEDSAGGFRYTYALANHVGPLSEQPIFMWDFICPGPEGGVAVESPEGWNGRRDYAGNLDNFVCEFLAPGSLDVPPGDSASGFVISSSYLPKIGSARIWGLNPDPPLFEDAVEVDPEVAELRAKATGNLGGWFELPIVLPGRAPAELSDPAQGLQALMADLGEACQLEWIDQTATCPGLRAKLDASAAALARGDSAAANEQLRGFLRDIEAQHGGEPGQHVNDDAYWLLRTNVEFVRSKTAAHGGTLR